jgi:hypothetical protein
MTTTMTAPLVDRIADAFIAGDVEALVALYRSDALVDAVIPYWRFQLQGADALREVLVAEEFLPGRRVTRSHRTATEHGLLLEIETWAPIDGADRMWLSMHQFRIADDAIAEHVVYCSGVWDPATIARHAVEAPMVRPR